MFPWGWKHVILAYANISSLSRVTLPSKYADNMVTLEIWIKFMEFHTIVLYTVLWCMFIFMTRTTKHSMDWFTGKSARQIRKALFFMCFLQDGRSTVSIPPEPIQSTSISTYNYCISLIECFPPSSRHCPIHYQVITRFPAMSVSNEPQRKPAFFPVASLSALSSSNAWRQGLAAVAFAVAAVAQLCSAPLKLTSTPSA